MRFVMSWFTPSFLLNTYNEPVLYALEMRKKEQTYEKREIVAEWRVPIEGQIFKIEFEHGTTSGKRVIWINEKEILRREWMFRLVGDDRFKLGKTNCFIRVEPAPGFRYKYSMFVDGKPLEQFTERQAKALKSWEIKRDEHEYFVVLEKHSLNLWVNGKLIEEPGDFVEEGTDTAFQLDGNNFILSARQNEIPRHGIIHTLNFNGDNVPAKTYEM